MTTPYDAAALPPLLPPGPAGAGERTTTLEEPRGRVTGVGEGFGAAVGGEDAPGEAGSVFLFVGSLVVTGGSVEDAAGETTGSAEASVVLGSGRSCTEGDGEVVSSSPSSSKEVAEAVRNAAVVR